ncbi:uncharacterized protein N7459_007151 [Penicillium hispanicum]|uniref:uncharacterized protein n=1 Tax=Penicillium hispanicum TaxID=1080232 RepID=UPI00253FC7BA|nr:uncharacterized protein N7459_007151 [Penicillium hispanicum]KAJ5578187.1 hypothetical protein N7459_007151 [Penicillium hispanicum]
MGNFWPHLWPARRAVQYREIDQQSEELANDPLEKQPTTRWNKRDLIAIIGIVATICTSIAVILTIRFATSERALRSPESFFPKFSHARTSFVDEDAFLDEGPVGDEAWNSMMPLGDGYVGIPHPRNYNLNASMLVTRKGVPDPQGTELYGTSITHQLHCLGMLRSALVAYRKGDEPMDHDAKHLTHCLNYIRQGILCAGDTTLEPASGKVVINGELTTTFTGEGAVHQCKDWSSVKDFLTEKRVDNSRSSIAGA